MQSQSLLLQNLLHRIESTIKKNINSFSDAKHLSELIANQKLYVSPHTIGRLYGVIMPFRKPYKETLNILSQFLGYSDWEDFCQKENVEVLDAKYFQSEDEKGFSISLLQLALVNDDINTVRKLLQKTKYTTDNHNIFFSTSELIGIYARKSKNQEKLLQLLAELPQGRLLFYECFVDEDNPNNYYSDALLKYYLPEVKDINKELFVYAFLLSTNIYKGFLVENDILNFQKISKKIDLNKCHFHEISRFLECTILVDGINNRLKDNASTHINQILEIAGPYENFKKIWIIARPMRALIHLGFINELIYHKQFNELVDDLFENRITEFKSVALYILQIYYVYKTNLNNNSNFQSPPFRLVFTEFLNNENEKLAIEFALAYLHASENNKASIKQKLSEFCDNYGSKWVLKLVE